MKQRARRKRREDDLEEEEPQRLEEEREGERKPASEPAPTDRVLELQKSAGNRAVGAALARWGLPWVPMTAAATWPKESQVIVDGKVVPMSSFSWQDPHGGTGGAGTGRAQLGDVSVTTAVGDHSADLAQKTATGSPIKTVIIVRPGKDGKGFTITLTDVLISNYQLSGTTETWTMSYAKREFSEAPPPAKP